jgi:hypothetical protein
LFLRNKMNFFTRLRFRSETEAHLVDFNLGLAVTCD